MTDLHFFSLEVPREYSRHRPLRLVALNTTEPFERDVRCASEFACDDRVDEVYVQIVERD